MPELDDAALERRLRAVLNEHLGALPLDLTVDALDRRREAKGVARRVGRGRGMTLLAAASLLLVGGALAAGSGVLRLPEVVPPVPAPSFGVVATASPDAAPPGPSALTEPSAAPTASAVPSLNGIWIATRQMGTPRVGHTAVRLLDGRVLVAGGRNNERSALTSAELYDPVSGTWSATGNMLKPYCWLCFDSGGFPATLLRDGKVLVWEADDPAAETIGAEVYDPGSGTWTATGPMVKAADFFGGTATLLPDGRVLVAGGNVAGIDGTQLYDPATGTWSATGEMITPRQYHTATLLPDGKVLAAGGVFRERRVSSAELYDPDTGSWTATANTHRDGPCPKSCPQTGSMATLLQDGTLLFVRPAPDLESAEIYDPATGTWTPTGSIARPDAHYFTLTRLLDGTVLMAGGAVGPDDTVTAELYEPATGSWTETGNMLYGPSSATLLLDGTVLVTGDSRRDATSSAELYIPAGVSPPDLGSVPSPTPTPTPTATPVPTPTPTPYPPAAGPIPAGARRWTVTVDNKSSKPATLFVAEEDERGLLGRLVGSVTPNVVPPGATVQVTFRLPASGVDGWSIFVNPGPDDGPLLLGTDVPLAGEIHIDADGQVMWG